MDDLIPTNTSVPSWSSVLTPKLLANSQLDIAPEKLKDPKEKSRVLRLINNRLDQIYTVIQEKYISGFISENKNKNAAITIAQFLQDLEKYLKTNAKQVEQSQFKPQDNLLAKYCFEHAAQLLQNFVRALKVTGRGHWTFGDLQSETTYIKDFIPFLKSQSKLAIKLLTPLFPELDANTKPKSFEFYEQKTLKENFYNAIRSNREKLQKLPLMNLIEELVHYGQVILAYKPKADFLQKKSLKKILYKINHFRKSLQKFPGLRNELIGQVRSSQDWFAYLRTRALEQRHFINKLISFFIGDNVAIKPGADVVENTEGGNLDDKLFGEQFDEALLELDYCQLSHISALNQSLKKHFFKPNHPHNLAKVHKLLFFQEPKKLRDEIYELINEKLESRLIKKILKARDLNITLDSLIPELKSMLGDIVQEAEDSCGKNSMFLKANYISMASLTSFHKSLLKSKLAAITVMDIVNDAKTSSIFISFINKRSSIIRQLYFPMFFNLAKSSTNGEPKLKNFYLDQLQRLLVLALKQDGRDFRSLPVAELMPELASIFKTTVADLIEHADADLQMAISEIQDILEGKGITGSELGKALFYRILPYVDGLKPAK